MPAAGPRRLHLNAFLMNAGHHDAAWRHPRTQPERLTDLRYFQHLAQTAERGKLDSIFFADGLALWGKVKHNALGGFEPLTLLSALATVTERIGLIATVSTTFNEPFHTARKFASLDHLSGGRAGWNIVTSGTVDEARNFGQDEHLEHSLRYARAREFVEVATKLWDSWADDAVLLDRVRELIARLGGGRGHRVFAGTPEQVADQLEEWFTQGAADGFNVMPPHLPGGLEDFVDHVVPILQERGLFRTEYSGRTLREHYGLPRPAGRLASAVTATEGQPA
ncbi:LLM class flavin-dependent oxidoreductase [Streptomyces sp. NEAU-L66]|uniref:LLM class flavin-dependent oxidoreductase n=1 Tax=Streptomyces sp. NEAU-L66 TaxID=3390812 RepID=UPI0039C5CDCC